MTQRVNVPGVGMVDFPDGMAPEAITQAIERDILPQRRAKVDAGTQAWQAEIKRESAPGPMARFGRGFMDVAQGIKQGFKKATGAEDADAYSAEIREGNERYERGRTAGAGGDAGFDFLRLGGNVAATAPAMFIPGGQAAAMVPRVASVAAQGAASGAVQPVLDDQGDFFTQKAIQTGVGAVVAPVANEGLRKGAQVVTDRVLRPAGDFIRSTVARVRGAPPNPNAVLDMDGALTRAGEAALQKLGLKAEDITEGARTKLLELSKASTKEAKSMTPEQQLRAALFREVTGEEATLGQVTREFAQQQTEGELKKLNQVGDPLRARLARQNRGLLDAVEGVRKGTGGQQPNEYGAGQRVAESVKNADKEAREAVSMLYKAIDQEVGGNFKIKPQELLSRLDEVSDNAEGDAIVTSVQRRLSRLGLLNKNGEIKRGASLDAAGAEELRKFVGGLSGDTPNKRRMISMLVDSLDNDVRASAGEDVYEIARKVAKTRFEDLRIPAVRAIVDGDVPAEQIFDKYVRRGGIDDLKALKGYMSRKTDVATKAGAVERDPHLLGQGWDELRSQALGHIFEKSTRQAARNELDDALFSGAMFRKAMKDLGDEKLKVLFSAEELAKLEKIAKVAEWRIPMADVLNTSNTNSAWWNMVDRLLPMAGKGGGVLKGAATAVRQGMERNAQEAQVAASMEPGRTLADRATQAAQAKFGDSLRGFLNTSRTPSFFSIGAERKRQDQR